MIISCLFLPIKLVLWHDYNGEISPEGFADGQKRMDSARAFLWTIEDVRALMSMFEPIPEVVEWWPTVETVFARKLHGDCQSAAVLGKWALEQIGIPASIFLLHRNGWNVNHAIAVAFDGTVIISNRNVLEIPSGNWRDAALVLPGYEQFDRIEKL